MKKIITTKKLIIVALIGAVGIAGLTGLYIKSSSVGARDVQSEQNTDTQDYSLNSEDCNEQDVNQLSDLLESDDTREKGDPVQEYTVE